VREQTRRHVYLLHLLGIRQIAVVINKMDRVSFDPLRFRALETEIKANLSRLELSPTTVIPISARQGDGVTSRTRSLDWYRGPTVIEALDDFSVAQTLSDCPLRLPVQAVYKFDDRRIIAGRLETGRVSVGDRVAVMPSSHVAQVRSIEAWPAPRDNKYREAAWAGQSIGLTLDRDLFVERGSVITSDACRPVIARSVFARVFWLHDVPLHAGMALKIRIGTAESGATVSRVREAIDPSVLEPQQELQIATGHVGEIDLALTKPVAVDPYSANAKTGRLAFEIDGRIAGGGLILKASVAASPSVTPKTSSPADETCAAALSSTLMDRSPAQRIMEFRREISGRIVFTTSFGLEDQAIIHLLASTDIAVDIVTLDTGRLFSETYDVWAETERRYGLRVRPFYPDAVRVEHYIESHGINGFRQSREARQACCHVRKVVPLQRALEGARGWIVGLRADQSLNRGQLGIVTVEPLRSILKLSPFFDWTRLQVLDFAKAEKIPLNPLHLKGYASIGCAPCTRAIAPREPERAGRWWWENENKKECGVHRT
jgi:phosphoadenylyl-sulfate reductase (thioredoxin)